MSLTDTEIRRSKAKEKSYNLVDGQGLHLTITPAGGKLWRWKYRHDGKEKLMSPCAASTSRAKTPFASVCQKWMDHWHEDKSSRHV